MRATITWSYDLLTPAEQRLYRWLAVFAGGATLDAIETVCAAGTDEIIDIVAALVRKSLVRREEGNEEPRLSMLRTLRAYGLEQLQASGEVRAAIGPAAFADAWAAGRAYSIEQAQAEAEVVGATLVERLEGAGGM